MAFGLQTTVDQRMKNNGGFIAGPNHALLGDSSAAPAPEADGPSEAPNYRECDSAAQCCKTCENNDPQQSMCMLYQFQDSPMMVCDSWEPVGGMDQAQDQGEGESGMDDMMGGQALG